MKTLIFLSLLISTLPALTPAFAEDAPSAETIITQVDRVRNPGESYLMKVAIQDKASGDTSEFEVAISGADKTLVKTLAPARDRGRNLLMLAEEMWAYIPNLKRALRVSLAQKLTGQAANGDISRMRWSGDYTAKLEKTEASQWVLLLEARKKGLTYDKIRVRVNRKDYHPLEAEFLTPIGKPLKKAIYSGYKEIAGAVRPTEITIADAIRPDQVSVIQIERMEVKTFPASLFNQNNLK